MKRIKRIALLMGHDVGYCRDVLRGIQAYAIHKRYWLLHDGPPEPQIIPPLRQWKPHGVIAFLVEPKFARQVVRLNTPLVNICSNTARDNVPLVTTDHIAIGRLAAEHFLDRRFRHFGYFGNAWSHSSQQREKGFRERLAEEGFDISSRYADYLPRLPRWTHWEGVDREVEHWLQELPKPAAILACNDVPARHLAHICWRLGLNIPEVVALLGVDNDEMECRLTYPPLSSVAIPGEQIGYEAASTLDRLISGRKLRKRTCILDPIGVVVRQSTDVMAIDDPDVVAALEYIAHHAMKNIGVEDVAEQAGLGRRVLERRFQAVLGRTVLQEIWRVRIEQAKELLTETDLSMPSIASRSGFSSPQRMAVVFRKVTGMTPTEFRRRWQIRG